MDSWMDRLLDGSIDWQTDKQTIRCMHGRTKTTCLCAAITGMQLQSLKYHNLHKTDSTALLLPLPLPKYEAETTAPEPSATSWNSHVVILQELDNPPSRTCNLDCFHPNPSLQIYVIWWISGSFCFLIFNSSTKAVAESVKRCTTLSSKRSTTKSLGTHPS